MENTVQLSPPTLSTRILQALNILGFALMVFMNFLAVSLPLNGKTTGELSVKYENLFVPTGSTFSIWGIIYLLLLLFSVFQASSILSSEPNKASTVVSQLSVWYLVSSLLNASWIVAWHYEFVAVSVAIMLLLLVSLVVINLRIANVSDRLSGSANLLVKSSFGIYLGWICVATIANVTAWLTAMGWTGGFEQDTWTVLMILVGGVISLLAAIKLKNGFISLALIWALTGIALKRLDGDPIYYSIIAIAGVFIVLHAVNALVGIYKMNQAKAVKNELSPGIQ